MTKAGAPMPWPSSSSFSSGRLTVRVTAGAASSACVKVGLGLWVNFVLLLVVGGRVGGVAEGGVSPAGGHISSRLQVVVHPRELGSEGGLLAREQRHVDVRRLVEAEELGLAGQHLQ